MGLQDLFYWREKSSSPTIASMPTAAEEDLAADVDEPPDHIQEKQHEDFHKSSIHSLARRKQSLLTKALQNSEPEATTPEISIATDFSRRRSMMSNASIASTAELTSDGGLTSPARTNTPSPPFPTATYSSFAPYSLGQEAKQLKTTISSANIDIKESIPLLPEAISVSPKAQPPADVVPRKRCITFACGGRKDPVVRPAPTVPQPAVEVTVEQPKRKCMIKFACSGPKPSDKSTVVEPPKTPEVSKVEPARRPSSRSPSATRKSPRAVFSLRPSNARRSSHSPVAIRSKPKYIIADESTLQSSEATRFHEFASEELQEDDWIRKELENPGKKLTINDTLKKENAIRQLGNEAEEEALEEGEDEDEDEQNENDSDDETGFDDDENEEDSLDGSDDGASDGNETDNEAGFADSDDESDDGEFAFWTPGRTILNRRSVEAITYRASANDRTVSSNDKIVSASSVDSLRVMNPLREESRKMRKKLIKIRPGTPDLPDSTDFVCGTLDEDRPLEDAYVSCLAARKNAKHKQTPQDIDPSFPVSDIEDEEDEHDILEAAQDSDEHVWIHGKFEDSDEERQGRRRSIAGRRKSPGQSPRRLRSPPPPKRLHSPPPAKTRLRSPPPRKLFGGHSPKRMRSPPPARTIHSPPGSPTFHATSSAIAFAPLGSRPGLTHTKSLPRTPNAFCRQYRASRLIAANGDNNNDSTDGHVRGAIDIVKGLEQKRQCRKEKFYQKHPRKKGQQVRRPQPGKGAERMRELGLLMAGKTGVQNPYMLSA